MDYKLAKQLKEAGIKQGGDGKWFIYQHTDTDLVNYSIKNLIQ